ncbi:DUF1467 family protein [Stappia sp. ICDLI1TA098]
MSLISAIAIYFIVWWIVLFTILPIGVVTQQERGDVAPGTAPSAPIHPRLWRKALLTTVIAGIVFAGIYWLRFRSGLTLDDFPLKPPSG